MKKQHNVCKVFQIGFNKSGTNSLYKFFKDNGLTAYHFEDGKLADAIYENHKLKQPLLSGNKYGDFSKGNFYSDMEEVDRPDPIYIAQSLFKELDEQYPGSKFILNTRDKSKWLKSRSKHVCYNMVTYSEVNDCTYLNLFTKIYKCNENDVLERWSREWDEHHAAVKEYFKDRPHDLLVFNIENDNPQKLVDFLADSYDLNAQHYKHYKTELGVLMKGNEDLAYIATVDKFNHTNSWLPSFTPSFGLTRTQAMAGFFGLCALGMSINSLYNSSDTLTSSPS